MDFTAKDVQALREKTGCGMMDCKKALVESDGDMEKAVDFLREKGLAAAAKKSSRIAAEGAVMTYYDEATGRSLVIEVNAETDFVAKNEAFQQFTLDLAKLIAKENPADVEALTALTMENGKTVEDELKDKIYTIGENIKIRRFACLDGVVANYTHGGGRIGVLIKYDTTGGIETNNAFKEAARDIAMQIAAINPSYLDKDSVASEEIEKERAILTKQVIDEGKPEAIAGKIVDGKIAKFYKENCLMEQAFVKDGDFTVAKYLDKVAADCGGTAKAVEFVRFEKGDGLEKKVDNFAEEVAGMVN